MTTAVDFFLVQSTTTAIISPVPEAGRGLGTTRGYRLSWSLSADGKVLTVVGAASVLKVQPAGEKVTGELKVKRVYQRR